MSIEWIAFALCVCVSFTTEAATGFGSIILALALGAFFLPLETMLPVLVSLNVVMNTCLISRIFKHIHWPTFLTRIFPLMTTGMVCAWFVLPSTHSPYLLQGFALLTLALSLIQLFRVSTTQAKERHPESIWILFAGVVHGLYASGGPLLVYALSGTPLAKHHLRATLLLTWGVLNLSYVCWFAIRGNLQAYASHIALLSPLVLISLGVGQWLHQHIDEARYKRAVYLLLVVSSTILLIRT